MSGAEIMESTFKEQMKNVKQTAHKTLNLLKGNNDRLNGWRAVREYLKPIMKGEEVMASLQVFNTCDEFIRTVPALVFDTIKVEDVDTDGEDHAGDAIRYGLMSKPIAGKTQEQVMDDFFKRKIRKLQGQGGQKKPFKMTGY